MPLTFLQGELNSGKSTKLLEKFASGNAYKRGLFITPNQAISAEFKKHFLKTHASALSLERFLNWDLFVRRLSGCTNHLLEVSDSAMLITELINPEKLSYFKSTRFHSIAVQMAQTMDTLKRNFVTPDSLEDILKDRGGIKEFDLLQVYYRYEEALTARGLADKASLSKLAIESIKNGPKFLRGIDIIIFDEFINFGPEFLEILKAINTNCTGINLFVSVTPKGASRFKTIGGKIEESSDRFTPTSNIIPVVTRSPKNQIMFIKEQLNNSLASKEGCKIVLRKGSRISLQLARELGLQANDAWNNPVCAMLFSDSHKEVLPLTSALDEFVSVTRKYIKDYEDDNGLKTLPMISSIAALTQILDRFELNSQIMGLKTLTRETYMEFLKRSLQSDDAIRNIGDQFTIRYFEDGAGLGFDQMIMPDCTDDNYPRGQMKSLFFADYDGISLHPHPLLNMLFPPKEAEVQTEISIFQNFLAKCRGDAFFSYPLINTSGKENSPSFFLEKTDRIDPPPLKNRPTAEAIRRAKTDHIHEFKKRYNVETFSATGLESYAKCPFVFFVEKVLKIKPIDERTPDIQSKERGTIIHTVIEKAYRSNPNILGDYLADKESVLALLERFTDEAFKEHADIIRYARKSLIEMKRKTIIKMIAKFIEAQAVLNSEVESPLLPTCFELNFGCGKKNPFVLDIPSDQPAKFEGKIDRIDISDDGKYFMIIDYKSGKVESVVSKIEDGRHLQIPMYISAAKDLLPKTPFPLGGLLLSVPKPQAMHGIVEKKFNRIHYCLSSRSKSVVDEKRMNELIDKALNFARDYVVKIRNGEFSPKGENCPNGCEYAEICRCTNS